MLFEKGQEAFKNGQANLIINRGKPPIAGIISWASSIMNRIKGPILKFHKNEEILDQNQYALVKQDYLSLIKEIDAYKEGKFNEWVGKIIEKAMGFLKLKILEKDENGFYRVNFKE